MLLSPQRRLLLIVGKGGVGRTTVAAAFALLAARSGKKVLLAQTKSKDHLGTLFGVNKTFPQVEQVQENLWAVNMTPEASMREYGTMVLRSEFFYKQVFERDIVRAFLRAIPGLWDYSMLGKVWFHTTQESKPRFDLVILDAPATGHSITLLRIPQVILQTVPEGPLTPAARACHELLTDPERTQTLIVTLAEDLPTSESGQLRKALLDLRLPLGPVVVNRLYPPRFAEGVSALALEEFRRQTEPLPSELAPLVAAARLMQRRAALNEEYIEKLKEVVPGPQIHLPYLFTKEFGPKALEDLARRLEGQGES